MTTGLRLAAVLTVAGMMMGAAPAASAPATGPATGRGPVNPYTPPPTTKPTAVANARDQKPFTNESVANVKAGLPTLYIAGDSTAATGNATTRGWASVLVDYFDTDKVNLVNQAQGGARFNGYIDTRWPAVVAAVKPGDFVVIQFGHNSGPLAGIGEETQAATGRGAAAGAVVHSHGWYVKKFVQDVRAKQGIPIVTTLTLRDLWKDGKVERLKEQVVGQGGMSDWTRRVAAAEKVLLVDHSNIIGDMYDRMGMVAADPLFGDRYLHTNTAGAIVNCEAFIAGLKAIPEMPLVGYLNEKGKAIPAYSPADKR